MTVTFTYVLMTTTTRSPAQIFQVLDVSTWVFCRHFKSNMFKTELILFPSLLKYSPYGRLVTLSTQSLKGNTGPFLGCFFSFSLCIKFVTQVSYIFLNMTRICPQCPLVPMCSPYSLSLSLFSCILAGLPDSAPALFFLFRMFPTYF